MTAHRLNPVIVGHGVLVRRSSSLHSSLSNTFIIIHQKRPHYMCPLKPQKLCAPTILSVTIAAVQEEDEYSRGHVDVEENAIATSSSR